MGIGLRAFAVSSEPADDQPGPSSESIPCWFTVNGNGKGNQEQSGMPPSISKGHSVDTLVTAIRAEIMSGTLGPGRRINQDEWAERTNVSRTPVRVALERLEAEGFVKLLPRRGAVVVEMTPEYLEDILCARLILEAGLGRAGANNLTPEDMESLRATYEEIQAIPLPEEHRSLVEPTHRFHMRLFEAAGTPMMQRFANQVVDHSHVFLNQYWYANRRLAQVTKLYFTELLAACEKRDLDRVETAIRDQRVDLAGVILHERIQVSELRVLPSQLSRDELRRLTAIINGNAEPFGPSKPPTTRRRRSA